MKSLFFAIVLFFISFASYAQETMEFMASNITEVQGNSSYSRPDAMVVIVFNEKYVQIENGTKAYYPIYLNISDDGRKRKILLQNGAKVTILFEEGYEPVGLIYDDGNKIIQYFK